MGSKGSMLFPRILTPLARLVNIHSNRTGIPVALINSMLGDVEDAGVIRGHLILRNKGGNHGFKTEGTAC
jgi:hypothetical protein